MAERVRTQVSGNVWKIVVQVGSEVQAGDTLFILELMKTEVPHTATTSGRVTKISISEGETVDADQDAIGIE